MSSIYTVANLPIKFKHPVHDSLKCRRDDGQPKAQNLEQKVSLWGAEGRLGHILRGNPDLLVARCQV
jgi:hypothetical protein